MAGHGRPCRPYAAAYECNTGFLANDNTTQILTQQQGFSHQGRKLTTVPEMMLKCSLTLSMCKGGREIAYMVPTNRHFCSET